MQLDSWLRDISMSDEKTTILTDKDVSTLLEIANLACHKGFPNAARNIVEGILAERKGFVPATITLAYSYVVVDEFDKALGILDEILDRNPDDGDARVMQVLAFMLSGRSDEAKQSLGRFNGDSPQKQLAFELIQNL